MTTYLLLDDALRSLELRHEIGEPIMDPIIFIEHEDRRIVVGTDLEASTFETREDVVDEFWNAAELGREELIRQQTFPLELVTSELGVRALERLGAFQVSVPPSFSVQVADYLRDKGIDVVVDTQAWIGRRRRKAPWELEGIERAQRAADTAMMAARRMLREAEPTGRGDLRFEGEILTAELIRAAMEAELLALGADSSEIIVHSGDACLRGHEIGFGPVLPDTSCIIDCFPRDRRTGAYTDMTRTFVPGVVSDELRTLHSHCRKALDIAVGSLKPGASDHYRVVAEYFDAQGYPTQMHSTDEAPVREGFSHSLGHGVGLEIHERPYLGRRADPLAEGDVVAIEPGLYFGGIGGVRLEDTILVTESGIEHFTDPLPYDLEP